MERKENILQGREIKVCGPNPHHRRRQRKREKKYHHRKIQLLVKSGENFPRFKYHNKAAGDHNQ
jgi:hypothetical protein